VSSIGWRSGWRSAKGIGDWRRRKIWKATSTIRLRIGKAPESFECKLSCGVWRLYVTPRVARYDVISMMSQRTLILTVFAARPSTINTTSTSPRPARLRGKRRLS
jgi:hypothetical protein